MNLSELKAAEEAKRDRAYDPAERWRHIQETITWAEANMKPECRRNRPRWHRPAVSPAANSDGTGQEDRFQAPRPQTKL